MRKKILLLISLFLVLAAASIVLLLKGKPSLPNHNPLLKIKDDQVGQLVLAGPTFSATLEKSNGKWALTAPIVDVADRNVADRVVSVLRGAVISSMISENLEKHAQFQVDAAQALSIKCTLVGQQRPQLDLLMGKDAATFGSVYVRFADKNQVYVAEGLPGYVIPRSTDEYRLRKVFQFDSVAVTTISIVSNNLAMNFVRSSDTWVNSLTNNSVDSGWITSVLKKLSDLDSYRFVHLEKPDKKNGLDKPILTLEVSSVDRLERVVIGSPISDKNFPDLENATHFANVSGRPDALAIQEYRIKDLSSFLAQSPVSK